MISRAGFGQQTFNRGSPWNQAEHILDRIDVSVGRRDKGVQGGSRAADLKLGSDLLGSDSKKSDHFESKNTDVGLTVNFVFVGPESVVELPKLFDSDHLKRDEVDYVAIVGQAFMIDFARVANREL